MRRWDHMKEKIHSENIDDAVLPPVNPASNRWQLTWYAYWNLPKVYCCSRPWLFFHKSCWYVRKNNPSTHPQEKMLILSVCQSANLYFHIYTMNNSKIAMLAKYTYMQATGRVTRDVITDRGSNMYRKKKK